MPYVTVGQENTTDVGLYYEDHGFGPPVVLVHGWPLSSRSWEQQVPALVEDGYRVIAYSRRGHAGSDAVDPKKPGTAAGDLHALIEHLGLKQCHLLGSAAGGGIALDYALSHPGLVLSLAMVCAVGGIVEPEYVERATRLRPRRSTEFVSPRWRRRAWRRAARGGRRS